MLETDADKPLVALAFKLEDGRYGQLTYMRIYQGTLKKDDSSTTSRPARSTSSVAWCACTPTRWRTSTSADAGDIVALFGIDCDVRRHLHRRRRRATR